jgi:colanic acid/amylovoran biosynthesis glycosyltransferase
MHNFTSLFRAINRKDKLRIGSFSTHEAIQAEIAKTGHQFIHIKESPENKQWNDGYRKRPRNIIEISFDQFKSSSGVDILISNTISQQQFMGQLAKAFNLPHITFLYCYHPESWSNYTMENIKVYEKSDYMVFLTEDQRKEWRCEGRDNCFVINHAIDNEFFKSKEDNNIKTHILTVANFYKERNSELNYTLYEEIKQKCPQYSYLHLGSSSNGEYKPAKDVNELVDSYTKSKVFVNTCHRSVIPTTVLEAMSCGVPVLSTYNPTLEKLIKHGENGYLFSTVEQAEEILNILHNDEENYKKISENARQTIINQYNIEKSNVAWNNLFNKVLIK